jgi:hypothetical protein
MTEGAIPNCGVSSDLCHPSCAADDSSISVGGNGSTGGNSGNGSSSTSGSGKGVNGGGPKKLNNNPDAGSVGDGSRSNKRRTPMVASIVGVAGMVALVTYKVIAQKNAAAAAAAAASG